MTDADQPPASGAPSVVPEAVVPEAVVPAAVVPGAGVPSQAVPPASGEPVAYQQQLSRMLSLRENVLITLSSVTPASSVFIIAPAVLLGVGGASLVTFAIAAVAAAFVGMCYAELSSRLPITGGEYTWAARLLGRPVGFATFLLSLVSGVLITAVIALGTGEYLGVAWGGLSGAWVGVAVIVVCAVVACLNIRTNAWVTGVFLLVEIAALVLLTVLGVTDLQRGPGVFLDPVVGTGDGVTAASWTTAFALIPVALFAYNGYGAAVYYVEETRDATRTIGRIIMGSLLITVLVEMVPLGAVLLGAPDLEALLNSPAPMNYFLTARAGGTVNAVVSVGIAVAIINAVIAIMIQISRLLYASARDHSWPDPVDRALGSVSDRFLTPVNATLVVGVAAATCAALVPLSWLLTATGASVVVVYVVVALCALRVRLAPGGEGSAYRMRWWPLPPLVVLAMMGYVTYQVLSDAWTQMAVAIGTMLVGIVYYFGYIHPRRSTRWTLPDPVREEV